MHIVTRLIASVGLAVIFASPAVGMQDDRSARLVTMGTGEVSLAPDWAMMTFDITADDSSAVSAAATGTQATERVLAALADLGYSGDSLVRVSFSVQPRYDWSQGQQLVGYSSRSTVRLDVRDLDLLARIIDAALSAGATGVADLRFRSDTEDEAREDALRQAVALARRDAEILADAAGGRLGEPLVIKTNVRGLPSVTMLRSASARRVGQSFAPDLTPQDVIVSVVVETEWELLNART